jgi:hypothetical protein
MPMYFKDLRTGAYILFRAYLEGLTESVSPSWASTNYIGRSEPVWIYERAEREISFTLKLVAQTHDELKVIYQKLNKLTSLCYPEYEDDTYGKNRMKPPLTQFRLGDLYGSSKKGMLGFIKALSYNVDNTSPWETKPTERVPRHISAAITYHVIHGTVPSLTSDFYGMMDHIGEEDLAYYDTYRSGNDSDFSVDDRDYDHEIYQDVTNKIKKSYGLNSLQSLT